MPQGLLSPCREKGAFAARLDHLAPGEASTRAAGADRSRMWIAWFDRISGCLILGFRLKHG
jgi:hypothetical protein